jgi:hypothetical protein
MRGAIPPLPQYTFMAWWAQLKHRDNFTINFTFKFARRNLGKEWKSNKNRQPQGWESNAGHREYETRVRTTEPRSSMRSFKTYREPLLHHGPQSVFQDYNIIPKVPCSLPTWYVKHFIFCSRLFSPFSGSQVESHISYANVSWNNIQYACRKIYL